MATGLIGAVGVVGTVSAIFFLNSQNQNAGVTVQGLTRIAIPEKLPKVDQNINPDERTPPELSEKNKVSFIKRQETRIDAIQKSPNSVIDQIPASRESVEEEYPVEGVYWSSPIEMEVHTQAKSEKPHKDSKFKELTPSKRTVKPLWRVNSINTEDLRPGPQIAIVIDDAGVDKLSTKHAIELSGPLTISFLTYATKLNEQVKKAKSAGHEIMAHVPMEPFNKTLNPGPNFLRVDDSDEEIRKNIKLALTKVPESVGINNHMGSRFTSNVRGVSLIMEELSLRGLLFLDSRTSEKTVVPKLARKYHVPYVTRNVFLDHEPSLEFILAQLEVLEKLAKKQGYAVAIGHPRATTISALSQWLPVIAEKGLNLVPISVIMAKRIGIPRNLIKLTAK